ncbi:MAG: sporulation initiation factor Spo0A C-terminal domain-containing protein [Clostridiales bacterium]|nr:sporulation initiation factor Spo0A C-terminal domain-containing protein [Clostridiales bacterium]
MKTAESMLRFILGPTRSSILSLALAVERTAYLCFVENRSMDDIVVTKDIYAFVAAQMEKTPGNASRAIERLANLCWDALCADDELIRRFIGKSLLYKPTPAEMLFYLAYVLRFDKPYYLVLAPEDGAWTLMI